MKNKSETSFIAWRFNLAIIIILLIVAGLVLRMIDLTVIKKNFLRNQGASRAIRIVSTPAFRGMITDRNGFPLAISTSVYSIWVNPKEFDATPDQIKKLSQLLEIDFAAPYKIIKFYKIKKREFMYLKREVMPDIAKQIKLLKIPGIYLRQDYKRFYPEGEAASHVLGFTNVDDQGQEGLELSFNAGLAGQPGKKIVEENRLGQIINELQTVQEQKPGTDLTLSINRRLQYLAYRELLAGIQNNLASSGTVVILDVQTGEILAMVNYPSFNPNGKLPTDKDVLRNRAVTDIFEPGSTIKAFSIATALASGKYTPDTVIDTSPGWIAVGGHVLKDEHPKNSMTLGEVIQRSSDVGTTKIVLTLPPDELWNLLHDMGFGQSTNIDFPGEQAGRLVKRKVWKPLAVATLSFGYGMSVTPLQLAHAYATLANDGVKIPLSILKVNEPPKGGVRVMDHKVDQEMLSLLESVVSESDGTGTKAQVPGYRVGGKTGTAKIAIPHGYANRYVSSFVGMAPMSNPRLVVAVIIRDPRGKVYYGGDVSCPVFKNIMQGSLRLLDIAPDAPIAPNPHG